MRLRAAALLVGLAFASPGSGLSEMVDEAPIRVTTDTPEYCSFLAERLHADRGIVWTAELRDLAFRGEDMCRDGHLRMGIGRLRRAWMLAHPDH